MGVTCCAPPPRDRHPQVHGCRMTRPKPSMHMSCELFSSRRGKKTRRKNMPEGLVARSQPASERKCAQVQTPGKNHSACNGPRNRGAVMRSHRRERGKLVGVSQCMVGSFFNFNEPAISRNGYEFSNQDVRTRPALRCNTMRATNVCAGRRAIMPCCHAHASTRAHVRSSGRCTFGHCWRILRTRGMESHSLGRAERSRPKPQSGATEERP
jgi:hypothetical protein